MCEKETYHGDLFLNLNDEVKKTSKCKEINMGFKVTATNTTSTNQDRPQVDFKAMSVEEGYFG